MAVLGASRAYKDWQVANNLLSGDESSEDDSESAPTPSAVPIAEDVKDYSDRELKAMEEEDPLSLIDSLNSRVGTPVLSTVTSRELSSQRVACARLIQHHIRSLPHR